MYVAVARRFLCHRARGRVLTRRLLLSITAGSLVLQGAASSLEAQTTPTAVAGFGVSYRAPAGWALSGQQGRIHAWSNGTESAALVVYAGHYSSLELALGDAQRVLGTPRDDDMQIVSPLTAVRMGAYEGMAGTVRVTGSRSVLAHVAVAQLNDSTAIGAVTLLDGAIGDGEAAALAKSVREAAALLAAATVSSPSPDAALATQLTGSWEATSVYTSAQGGGYTNDESWRFESSGRYEYRKRFSVSVSGAAVTPEDRNESGRWYAMGGALVLISDEGRLTVDVSFDNDKLLLDATTFSRR